MLTGPQAMDNFSNGNLSPEEKRDVIAYLQSLEDQPDYGGFGLGGLGPVSEGLFAWLVGIGALVGVRGLDRRPHHPDVQEEGRKRERRQPSRDTRRVQPVASTSRSPTRAAAHQWRPTDVDPGWRSAPSVRSRRSSARDARRGAVLRLLLRLPDRRRPDTSAAWVNRNLQNRARNATGEATQPPAMPAPNANPPLLDISTTDHRVDGRLGLQCLEHVGKQLLIMLQVGVHYCDVRRGARQEFLRRRRKQARGGQSAGCNAPGDLG